MFVKEVVVQNKVGLYARPATYFIQKANEFQSSIWVEKEERRVNAKSLLGVLSLGIGGGSAIKIIADGMDEEEAVNQLVWLVESGFADVAGASHEDEGSETAAAENKERGDVDSSEETNNESVDEEDNIREEINDSEKSSDDDIRA